MRASAATRPIGVPKTSESDDTISVYLTPSQTIVAVSPLKTTLQSKWYAAVIGDGAARCRTPRAAPVARSALQGVGGREVLVLEALDVAVRPLLLQEGVQHLDEVAVALRDGPRDADWVDP